MRKLAGKRGFELHADVDVVLAGLGAHDCALQHAETGGRIESGRDRHFDEDGLAGGHALEGDEEAAGADVHGGAEFESGSSVRISAMYENGKGQGNPLPSTGLVFHLSHGLDFLTQGQNSRDAAGCWPCISSSSLDFGYPMRFRSFVFVVLLSALAFAADPPNFSGIWKIDPQKSDWGPQPTPAQVEYVIRHVGATISFNYTMDGNTARVDIVPDNEERVTNTTEETATWTRAHWSGNALILEARERKRFGTQGATGPTWTSRWTLSDDGKEFIIDRTLRNAGMEAVQHLVFERQPLPPKTHGKDEGK